MNCARSVQPTVPKHFVAWAHDHLIKADGQVFQVCISDIFRAARYPQVCAATRHLAPHAILLSIIRGISKPSLKAQTRLRQLPERPCMKVSYRVGTCYRPVSKTRSNWFGSASEPRSGKALRQLPKSPVTGCEAKHGDDQLHNESADGFARRHPVHCKPDQSPG